MFYSAKALLECPLNHCDLQAPTSKHTLSNVRSWSDQVIEKGNTKIGVRRAEMRNKKNLKYRKIKLERM